LQVAYEIISKLKSNARLISNWPKGRS
jgi:hypothetical protein